MTIMTITQINHCCMLEKDMHKKNRPANTLYITPAILQSVSHAEPGNGGTLI